MTLRHSVAVERKVESLASSTRFDRLRAVKLQSGVLALVGLMTVKRPVRARCGLGGRSVLILGHG